MQERFDYDLLSEGDAIWLKRQTEAIKSNFRDEVYLKLKNGLRLRRVKARINKGHFLTWIDLEFSWSRTTANRLIRLVEVVEKFFLKRISTVENLSEEDKKIFWKNLDEGTFDSTVHAVLELLNNFSTRVLYKLINVTTEVELLELAFQAAMSGEYVDAGKLEQLEVIVKTDNPPKSNPLQKEDILPRLVDSLDVERARNEMVEATFADVLRTPITVSRPGTYRVADILPRSLLAKLEAINLWDADPDLKVA